jgi:quercetin dioxygenase-like cupin family protein
VTWTVVSLDAVQWRAFPRGRLRPLNTELGVSGFGLSEIELPPGGAWVEHDELESGQEEVYIMTRGSGVLHVHGSRTPLRAGDVVLLSPEERRQIIAGPGGVAWIAIGGPAGWYEAKGV